MPTKNPEHIKAIESQIHVNQRICNFMETASKKSLLSLSQDIEQLYKDIIIDIKLCSQTLASIIHPDNIQSVKVTDNETFKIPSANADSIKSHLINWLLEHDYHESDAIDTKLPFAEMGLTSIDAVALADTIQTKFLVDIDATVAWQYPTIDTLTKHIVKLTSNQSQNHFSDAQKPSANVRPNMESMAELSLEDMAFQLENLISMGAQRA